jgi:hypothetical protein
VIIREVRAAEHCGGAGDLYSNGGKGSKIVYQLCNTLDDRALPISVLDAVKMS